MKQELAQRLEEARARTWDLVAGLSDADLASAATDYLSPPVWDLGHMANFEELWLVQKMLDCAELHDGYNDIYDAFRHPRSERPQLDLLDRDGARDYMAEVRARVLGVLGEVDLQGDRLCHNGFVYWMLIMHEYQHQETLLQTIALRGQSERYQLPQVRKLPDPRPVTQGWIHVPAGSFEMGTAHEPGIYDNEAPAHTLDVAAYEMCKFPVTNGEYLDFIEAGGYDDSTLWSERGQQWLAETDHHAPLHWRFQRDGWHRIGYGCHIPIRKYPDEILCHVSYFEAQAFAKWRSARLPTEAEWERACRGGRNPWGDALATTDQANIDQLAFAPSRVGAYPDGASALGFEHMIGDVWEWTSSRFEPYPGFEAFPYDEYSKVFFGGDYQILRGGSWATRDLCATGTFRNWDHPYRRQIFSGIRLARDA